VCLFVYVCMRVHWHTGSYLSYYFVINSVVSSLI